MNIDIQNIIVLLIIAGCLLYVGRNILRFFRKGSQTAGCGCGCPGCSKSIKTKDCITPKSNK
ncbi:MAG: FeoB-associated Cys-rich membrane protein [Bacteroides sp.]|nr:FeoB-associated Cys-rich membrane protein [Bacteroides sp.]